MMTSEDYAKIKQLIDRYGQAVDKADAKSLAACYTADVQIIVPGMPVMSGPDISEMQVQGVKNTFEKTQHRMFNIIYDVVGDTAEGETYCSALHIIKTGDMGKPVVLEWLIRYQDKLVRQDNEWKIQRRELIVDWEEQRSIYSA